MTTNDEVVVKSVLKDKVRGNPLWDNDSFHKWTHIKGKKEETWETTIGDYSILIRKFSEKKTAITSTTIYEWSTNRTGEWGKPQQASQLDEAMNAAIHQARSWSLD